MTSVVGVAVTMGAAATTTTAEAAVMRGIGVKSGVEGVAEVVVGRRIEASVACASTMTVRTGLARAKEARTKGTTKIPRILMVV